MWIIPTDRIGLTGVLNSKMGWWLITKYCTQIQNGYQLIWKYFGQIPIPPIGKELDELVRLIIGLTKDLADVKLNLSNLLSSKFDFKKISRKLQNWHELTFGEFLKELKKKKVKLSLSEEAEWMDYFSNQKEKAQSIQTEIDRVDREIDAMVYQLYGLTEEEIALVEDA